MSKIQKKPRKKRVARANPNLVKLGQSYAVEELSKALKVCTKTVLNWKKDGLCAIDDSRPILFAASTVRKFLRARCDAKTFKCQADEFLCLKCKAKRKSVNADLKLVKHISNKCFALHGRCEVCQKAMRKMLKNADAQKHFAHMLHHVAS